MFVFLWLWVIYSVLWLCCCVTVKPANQLNQQLGEQRDIGTRHFYARIQQSLEFCKEKHRAFPAWRPVKEFLRCSQVLSPHFLQFFNSPPWLHGSAASPLSGPTSCLLSPTQDAPLSSPLCYFDLLFVSAGPCPQSQQTVGWDYNGPSCARSTEMFCMLDLRFVCNSQR